MPQLAVRNRYDQQSQQLGQDIAGTISGAYEGYQKGKERQETSRLRGIQTQSAEMTLEQQMRKIEEAKTSKKAFETLKKGAMDEIRAGMQNQASMARGEKILKMYDSIQFEGGKGVDKLAKYTATKQELDDFSKKSKDEKLGLGDYPVEYISAGSGLFQKSYEKAKQSALGKKQVSAMKDAKTKGEATQAGVGEGEEPLTPQAKEMAGAKPAEMTPYQQAMLALKKTADEKAAGQREVKDFNEAVRNMNTVNDNLPTLKRRLDGLKGDLKAAEQSEFGPPNAAKELEAQVTEAEQELARAERLVKYTQTILKETDKYKEARRTTRNREYAALERSQGDALAPPSRSRGVTPGPRKPLSAFRTASMAP